jgi:hypothetical protein
MTHGIEMTVPSLPTGTKHTSELQSLLYLKTERVSAYLEGLDDHLVRLRVVALDGFRHPASEPESGDLLTVIEFEGGSGHFDKSSGRLRYRAWIFDLKCDGSAII